MTWAHHVFLTVRTGIRGVISLMALTVALTNTATAQSRTPDSVHQVPNARVTQAIFLDLSHQLAFDAVRLQKFQPIEALARLPTGGKVSWLRLHIEQAEGNNNPIFLHIRPTFFSDMVLYTPEAEGTAGWGSRRLGEREALGIVALGALAPASDVYLRLASNIDVPLVAFVSQQREMQSYERKLDVIVAIFSTLIAIGFLTFLWRTLRKFNWMSALIAVLLALIFTQTMVVLGYYSLLFDLPVQIAASLAVPMNIGSVATASAILILLSTELFTSQRWLRWLWGFTLVQVGLLVLAWWVPVEALRMSGLLVLLGLPTLGVSLLRSASCEPQSLQTLASKLAFLALLIVCIALFFLKVQDQVPGNGLPLYAADASDLFVHTLLLRGISPLFIVSIASWIFERLHQQRVQSISEALHTTKASLDLESKRLERQRKFTAMLAHELKNPLTVSHMALSGIESRLGTDEPILARTASIKQSLQDIDAIIDRCSEMDGFEQGHLPMAIAPFTLGHLMTMIKTANNNERIYTLIRGMSDETLLVSDIHYLKIIFNNLLTNALKYSPPDTLIELAVRVAIAPGENKTLEFCVSNQVGVAGVPSAELAFERFYRAEAARKQSGAGIGLWLSQSLASALGTKVLMHAEGSRITFSLALPYA